MRSTARLLLALCVVARLCNGKITVTSITEQEVTFFVNDSQTTVNEYHGPGSIVLPLICGPNVFPVTGDPLPSITVNSLCPLASFSVRIGWMSSPGMSPTFYEWNEVIEGTRLGLLIAVNYSPCSDGGDFCNDGDGWIQWAGREMRPLDDGCKTGSVSSVAEELSKEIAEVFPLRGKVCVRELAMKGLWEIFDSNENTAALLDDVMSFQMNSTSVSQLGIKPVEWTLRHGTVYLEQGDSHRIVKRAASPIVCDKSTTLSPSTTVVQVQGIECDICQVLYSTSTTTFITTTTPTTTKKVTTTTPTTTALVTTTPTTPEPTTTSQPFNQCSVCYIVYPTTTTASTTTEMTTTTTETTTTVTTTTEATTTTPSTTTESTTTPTTTILTTTTAPTTTVSTTTTTTTPTTSTSTSATTSSSSTTTASTSTPSTSTSSTSTLSTSSPSTSSPSTSTIIPSTASTSTASSSTASTSTSPSTSTASTKTSSTAQTTTEEAEKTTETTSSTTAKGTPTTTAMTESTQTTASTPSSTSEFSSTSTSSSSSTSFPITSTQISTSTPITFFSTSSTSSSTTDAGTTSTSTPVPTPSPSISTSERTTERTTTLTSTGTTSDEPSTSSRKTTSVETTLTTTGEGSTTEISSTSPSSTSTETTAPSITSSVGTSAKVSSTSSTGMSTSSTSSTSESTSTQMTSKLSTSTEPITTSTQGKTTSETSTEGETTTSMRSTAMTSSTSASSTDHTSTIFASTSSSHSSSSLDTTSSTKESTSTTEKTTTTLGTNVDCVITSSSLSISSVISSPSIVQLSEEVAVTVTLIQSTGICVRLQWAIDGEFQEGGLTVTRQMDEGDHTFCYFNDGHKIDCGYVRVVASLQFTNMCSEVDELKKRNDSLVLVTPRVPIDDPKFNWTCEKKGEQECYTPVGKFLTMRSTVSMTPIEAFLTGIGEYTMTANVSDPLTGQWSCIRYFVTVEDWPTTTMGTTTMTESTSISSSTTATESGGASDEATEDGMGGTTGGTAGKGNEDEGTTMDNGIGEEGEGRSSLDSSGTRTTADGDDGVDGASTDGGESTDNGGIQTSTKTEDSTGDGGSQGGDDETTGENELHGTSSDKENEATHDGDGLHRTMTTQIRDETTDDGHGGDSEEGEGQTTDGHQGRSTVENYGTTGEGEGRTVDANEGKTTDDDGSGLGGATTKQGGPGGDNEGDEGDGNGEGNGEDGENGTGKTKTSTSGEGDGESGKRSTASGMSDGSGTSSNDFENRMSTASSEDLDGGGEDGGGSKHSHGTTANIEDIETTTVANESETTTNEDGSQGISGGTAKEGSDGAEEEGNTKDSTTMDMMETMTTEEGDGQDGDGDEDDNGDGSGTDEDEDGNGDGSGTDEDEDGNGDGNGSDGDGTDGSDGSSNGTEDGSTAGSIRKTTTTKEPMEIATMSSESKEKIEQVTMMLEQIGDPKGVKEECSKNNSALASIYSTMTENELKTMAQTTMDGTRTDSKLSKEQLLELLKSSGECVNDDLASVLEDVLKELSEIPIDSPDALSKVLEQLQNAIDASRGGSLGNGQIQRALEGEFPVLYGTLETEKYVMVSTRSTVRIAGKLAYISGDMRPARLQTDTAKTQMYDNPFGINGEYGGTDLFVPKSSAETRKLNGNRWFSRIDGALTSLDSDLVNLPHHLFVWNFTVDRLADQLQEQTKTAVTSWLPLEKAEIVMDGSRLQYMTAAPADSLTLQVKVQGSPVSVSYGSGTVKLLELRENSCILQYDKAKAVEGTSSTLLSQIQTPIVIENLDCSALESASRSSSVALRQADSSHPMALASIFPDVYEPEIMEVAVPISSVILPFGEAGGKDQMTLKMDSGVPIQITGKITIKGESTTLTSPATVQYTGKDLQFIYGAERKILYLRDVNYKVDSVDGKTSLVVQSALFENPTEPHLLTQVEVSASATIYLSGGDILRNGTHGYLITNAIINHTGVLPPGAIDLNAQSLLNQEAQNLVMDILKGTADFLKANSSQMTEQQLNDTAAKLLTMAGSIIETMIDSLNNPLSSDLAKNLAYEKNNYDDLFNVLPEDAGDIRYIEEYTEDEWAKEATRISQQNIARNMAKQLKETMGALGDALAERYKDNAPYLVSMGSGGASLIEAGGNASYLFSQDYECDGWTTRFPPTLADLNIHSLTENDELRVSMLCYRQNPYAYSVNYDPLITSGTVDVLLKTMEAKEIRVADAPKPVMIRGKSNSGVSFGTIATPTEFKDIQILDLHTFRATAWNFSLSIEVQAQPDHEEDIPEDATFHFYVSFQGIPGPMPQDHDFGFQLDNPWAISRFFMDSSKLKNSSGLYYFGLGIRMNEPNDMTVNYTINGEPWYMLREVLFDYRVRILTKGCYSFNEPNDRFDSNSISSLNILKEGYIQCASHHLTAFSIGLFQPEIPVEFDYIYVEDCKPMNIHPMLCAVFVSIFFIVVIFNNYLSDLKDRERGMLRLMKNNRLMDKYIYIVVVETGHHMFSTSDSLIRMNFTGTEGQEVGRRLESEEDDVFGTPLVWGRTSRFIMTTRWPLGDLQYLRMWIDEPGIEHRESWFCSRVVVKDIQTDKIFYFPVDNWLGSNAGDGQTERLIDAVPRDTSIRAACRWNLLCETISYIAMFTGGGGCIRQRVERYTHTLSLSFSFMLVLLINIIIADTKNYDYAVGNIMGYKFEYWDFLIGFLSAILLPILSMILPHLVKYSMTIYDTHTVLFYTRRFADYNKPKSERKHVFEVFVVTVQQTILLISLVVVIVMGSGLEQDNAEAFMRRMIFGFVAWLLITEPSKGLLMAWRIVKKYPDHNIVTPLEKSLLPIEQVQSFPKADPRMRDDSVGRTYADLSQLAKTKDARMKEEKLFQTLREVLLLLGALFVFTGLSFASRDTGGFYYQTALRSLLNVDPPSKDLPFDRVRSFMEIRDFPDYWAWAQKSLVNGLRADWYDGQPAWGMRGFINDKVSRSMGSGVIRQIRNAAYDFNVSFPFGSANVFSLDETGPETKSFDTGWTITNETKPEYSYRLGEELMNTGIQGEFFNYAGGGYTISLQGTASSMREHMERLQQEGWIDRMTRAVIVEFSLYNAQCNYFAVVQLLAENGVGEYIHTSVWVESFRLFKYQGPGGNIIMIFEFLYIIYALIMFVKEVIFYMYSRYSIIKRGKLPRNPFALVVEILFGDLGWWRAIDLAVGILSIMSVIAFILRNIYVAEALDIFIANNGNTYINLALQRDNEMTFNVCFGGVIFFISIKMIRILKFNRRISILADTLDASAEDQKNLGIAFTFICCAFNGALLSLLQTKLEQYRSMIATFQTMVAALLGKYIIKDIYLVSGTGSAFFVVYMLMGTILMINVYVMIIMTSFEEVRNDPQRQANEYELLDHLKMKIKRSFGIFERSDCAPVAVEDRDVVCSAAKKYLAKSYLTLQAAFRTRAEEKIVGDRPARILWPYDPRLQL